MQFEPDRTKEVELKLRDLVWGIKGVGHIRPSNDPELSCYRISFRYQRRKPPKTYLLIYRPEDQRVTLCADGGILRPPENIRERLFGSLGRDNYEESYGAFHWIGLAIEDLV